MSKTAIKNLIRKTYNDLASENNDPITKYGLHGVNVTLAQLCFLAHPSSESAVDVVVEQLKAELAKLQDKEIPRKKWPRFFQDEHWKEKTYQRFGVSYQAPEKPVTIVQDEPKPIKVSTEGSKPGQVSARNVEKEIVNKIIENDDPFRSDGHGEIQEADSDLPGRVRRRLGI